MKVKYYVNDGPLGSWIWNDLRRMLSFWIIGIIHKHCLEQNTLLYKSVILSCGLTAGFWIDHEQ